LGLYKITDSGISTERVERANAVDWAARMQEPSGAERLARNFISGKSGLSPSAIAKMLVHAIRDYLQRCDHRMKRSSFASSSPRCFGSRPQRA